MKEFFDFPYWPYLVVFGGIALFQLPDLIYGIFQWWRGDFDGDGFVP